MAVRMDSDGPQLEGEALKREAFQTVYQIWRGVASNAPTVMVFDDLHWTDPASTELLVRLFQLTEEVPILFLCALRPERQSPGWQVKQAADTDYPHRYTEITIGPLSDENSDSLVSSLLTTSDLPRELRSLILQKAEGNPFFVEEVVRTLIESGMVSRDETGMHWTATTTAQNIAIPDSLQSLLVSRFDRLEEEVRRTLQLASVIGRSFYHKVLNLVSDTALALDRHLSTLQRVDLIREAARVPELEYIFRHELTREAAYNSILHRRRRAFHRNVGEAIETLFSDRLEDEAHRLAHHFDEGRDKERALKYYTMAGDRAARLYANTEAITNYDRALDIAEDAGASNFQLIHLYTSLGRSLEVSGRFDDALARYQELETLARRRGDHSLELAALIPQATVRSTFTGAFDPEQGTALSIRTIALARKLSDHQAEAKVLWNLMLLDLYANNNPARAVTFGEQSLAIAREHNLREESAYALTRIHRRTPMDGVRTAEGGG